MPTKPSPNPHPRVPLSRERVLDAAVALADEGGIESLSMRKLAQALGVEAMSLYNHVANKGDLVEAIVDRVVAEIELPSGADWETAIRRCAVSAHDALLRHPWACSLVISPGAVPGGPNARLRYIEWMLATLRDAGFSPELTYHAYHALDSYILGFTYWQLGHSIPGEHVADQAARLLGVLPPGEFGRLIEHAQQHLVAPAGQGARDFAFGLDLIIGGLKRMNRQLRP
jgi:AcrR family transcriptional regulator